LYRHSKTIDRPMTKKVFLSLSISLLFSVALSAQKPGDWSVGMVFQPCLYWKYNKADWNNRPESYPEQPRKFNGWATGISVNRAVSEYMSIGGELSYSRQHQDFSVSRAGTTTNSGDIYHYNADVSNRLDYIKLPMFIALNREIGYESGLFVKAFCGPQLSFNSGYRCTFKQYEWNSQNQERYQDIIQSSVVLTPEYFHQIYLENNGTFTTIDHETPYLYRRMEAGVLGGFSLQKRLLDRYLISVGARYELGLTNVEIQSNKDHTSFGGQTFTGADNNPGPRPATHNRRLVLDLGISRIID
jgi:hypothetical protein